MRRCPRAVRANRILPMGRLLAMNSVHNFRALFIFRKRSQLPAGCRIEPGAMELKVTPVPARERPAWFA